MNCIPGSAGSSGHSGPSKTTNPRYTFEHTTKLIYRQGALSKNGPSLETSLRMLSDVYIYVRSECIYRGNTQGLSHPGNTQPSLFIGQARSVGRARPWETTRQRTCRSCLMQIMMPVEGGAAHHWEHTAKFIYQQGALNKECPSLETSLRTTLNSRVHDVLCIIDSFIITTTVSYG